MSAIVIWLYVLADWWMVVVVEDFFWETTTFVLEKSLAIKMGNKSLSPESPELTTERPSIYQWMCGLVVVLPLVAV